MKKNLFIAIVTIGMMTSCGGTSKEDMKSTADKICSCMSDKDANRGDVSEDVMAANVKSEFNDCAMDALNGGVDITSADFKNIMGENCGNLKDVYNAYLEGLK